MPLYTGCAHLKKDDVLKAKLRKVLVGGRHPFLSFFIESIAVNHNAHPVVTNVQIRITHILM